MPQRNAAHQNSPVLAAYHQRLEAGELQPDEAQAAAVARLDQLAVDLHAFKPAKTGLMSMFKRAPVKEPPRGLYMYGGVGRGKTMLMDLFYENTVFIPKQRAHFHEFMGNVHDRIGDARRSVDTDPIAHVAERLAPGPMLLCFDELHVTDIADAMILGRLFRRLFASGTILVATSNARPDDLYKHGLNRQLFLPFIDLLEDHTDVHMLDASKDFRLEKLVGRSLYFAPLDAFAKSEMDAHWDRLTGPATADTQELHVKGRVIKVPVAAMGVARFDFQDLCAQPLGPRDYLTIAHAFHTILIDNIPVLRPSNRNEARRFINLIDALYDNRVGLIASAGAEPDLLYPKGDGSDLFVRTASRLMEMRSPTYIQQRHRRAATMAEL